MGNEIIYENVQFNVNDIGVIMYGHIVCASNDDVYILRDIVGTFIEMIEDQDVLCDEILFWGDVKISKRIVKQPRFFAVYSNDTDSYTLGEIGKMMDEDITVESLKKDLNYDEVIAQLESICHGITHIMEYEPEELYRDIEGDMESSTIEWDMDGNIEGNMISSMIEGDMNGDIKGDMKSSTIEGDMNGDIGGNMINSTIEGDMNGNIEGDIINSTIKGSIYNTVKGKIY